VGGGRLLASGLAYSVSVFNLDAIWLKINTSESLSSCLLTVVFRDYYLVGADTPLQQLSFTSPLTSFDVYSEET
jgi:hypothetical protein